MPGSAYGLQPHRPASDVLTVVSAAVVLSPPCGWQLAARISTTSGAVPFEHVPFAPYRNLFPFWLKRRSYSSKYDSETRVASRPT